MKCRKCKSANIIKNGMRYIEKARRQQYKCQDCKYQWTESLDIPKVDGITAEERTDFEGDILPYLKNIGEKAKLKNEAEMNQVITMPDRPFAIALLSDIHGGAKTDYTKIEEDLNLIEDTEDMWVGNVGDNTDNFVNIKLQWIQREQPTTFDMEMRFLEWLFDKLTGNLLFWCSGNHDNWTKKATGYDITREALKDVKCLYDSQQIYFTLKWADNEQRWLVRHKWRHGSVFNPTHGMEVGWERVGLNFDVACGGHTHIATLRREFIRENKKRYAILLGTYKLRDNFGREVGFPKSHGGGSGAFVYHPDGREFWCNDLKTARDLLTLWQERF